MTPATDCKDRAEFYFKNFSDAERTDVETEIRNALVDVRAGRHDDELKRLGMNRIDLAQVDEMPYEIEEGQYLTGAEWALIYILAKAGGTVGVKVLIDIWTHIILPRLQQRYGSGRLRKERPARE